MNDSTVKVFGDENLRLIAQDLVKAVRSDLTIDWTLRENERASLRVIIKRILRKHGYPPDKMSYATELVLEQAWVLCRDWAAGRGRRKEQRQDKKLERQHPHPGLPPSRGKEKR